eukprot:1770060-Prorocentrum_lima.AAC.1
MTASSACSMRWPFSCYGLGSVHSFPRCAFAALMASSACSLRGPDSFHGLGSVHSFPRCAPAGLCTRLHRRAFDHAYQAGSSSVLAPLKPSASVPVHSDPPSVTQRTHAAFGFKVLPPSDTVEHTETF